jgi:hypothetical protein
MRILLTSPINPISSSEYSHRSAQAEIYAQQLYNYLTQVQGKKVDFKINYGNKEKDYDQYDVIYVYHGNDWSGVLNLFGGPAGLSDKEGLVALLSRPEKIVSLVIPMPDYAGLLRKRLKSNEKFGNILDQLPEYQKTSTESRPTFEGTRKLVVGDSHATSLYRPGWDVLSIPFKTCHGASKGLKQLIQDHNVVSAAYDEFEFYFGNIDIRHHLCRFSEPILSTENLASTYFLQVSQFPNASIYEPLPIENPSRKLPKTGYYKGTPYFGSWKERNLVKEVFSDTLESLCKNSAVTFVRWSDRLKNQEGELDFKYMEKPRSVHLARSAYPYWKGFSPNITEINSLERYFG